MTEETKEVIAVPNGKTPYDVVQYAISQGADLDKLEKFMVLQERWEAGEAKKAYTEAMAAFKSDPPEIEKDRHVSYQTSKGVTEYNHASLANVAQKINTALSMHGLSASWKTDQANGSIRVTCTITHKFGHSENTSLTADPDTSGSKNPIQAIGSTVSYLERYTILALTGLATSDMDDDGQGTGGNIEYISTDQVTEINDLIKETGADEKKFLVCLKAETIEKIPAKLYKNAIGALKLKQDKIREPGQEG